MRCGGGGRWDLEEWGLGGADTSGSGKDVSVGVTTTRVARLKLLSILSSMHYAYY